MARPSEKAKSETVSLAPLGVLAVFTVLMLTLPLGAYYSVDHYFPNNIILSSGAAVIAVQFIVAAYVYIAWREENESFKHETNEEKKKDR